MTHIFKYIVILFSLLLICCGSQTGRKLYSDPNSKILENENSSSDKDEEFDEDENYYTKNDVLDLSPYGFESIELLSSLKTVCEPGMEQEYFCRVLSNDAQNAIEILDQKISFKEEGQFLFRAKGKDRATIFMAPVVLQKDAQEDTKEDTQKDTNDAFGSVHGKLHLFKDRFYNQLYHVSLSFSDSVSQALIHWEITGGRYHIYDNEYPIFKRVRPFEKSILFLERKPYEVKATIRLGPQKTDVVMSSIDLSQRQDSSDIQAELESDHFEPRVSEKVHLKLKIQDLQSWKVGAYAWEVKKIEHVSCPEILDVESEAKELLCNQDFEMPLREGQDYSVEGDKDSDELTMVFKNTGEYLVRVIFKDENSQEKVNVARYLRLTPVLVTHR